MDILEQFTTHNITNDKVTFIFTVNYTETYIEAVL